MRKLLLLLSLLVVSACGVTAQPMETFYPKQPITLCVSNRSSARVFIWSQFGLEGYVDKSFGCFFLSEKVTQIGVYQELCVGPREWCVTVPYKMYRRASVWTLRLAPDPTTWVFLGPWMSMEPSPAT